MPEGTIRRDGEEPHEFLARCLKRSGLTAYAAAKATNGGVSATTIRTYMTPDSKPSASRLVALARVLGPEDGAEVLRAFGFEEQAEALADGSLPAAGDGLGGRFTLTYDAERPLTEAEAALVRSVVSLVTRAAP